MAKPPKMTLPAINLDLTLEAGKMKAVTAAATGKATDYIMPVDQIRVIPGFNPRVRETDDYRAQVDALKQSIRENGYYPNKPLAGFIGKDGDADVVYLTDGHTRLEAVQEINAEAVDESDFTLPGLPVSLKPAESSMAELTIALVQDNTGRPLTPYEMGVVVQRLANMKGEGDTPLYSKADIARKLSITERYIDDLGVLVAAPAKIRDAVLRGQVSSTLAIQELRRSPSKAEERIVAAVAKATAAGKTKATRKDVGSVKMQKVRHSVSLATGDTMGDVLKAVAGKVREIVGHSPKDEGDKLLTDGTITVIIEVPATAQEKPATAPKAAKAPAAAKKAAAAPAAQEKPAAAAKKAGGGAKKSGGAAKAAAPEGTSKGADEGGEQVKMPPAVPKVETDDPDDI